MSDDYALMFAGVYVVLLTLLVQMLVAGASKGARPGAVPGKIDPALSHESFVFRAHRTFMNSLENLPLFIGTVVLAVWVGTDPWWAGFLVWLYALGRIGHMVLYYALATERNPSPRSYFYALALLANVALLGLIWLV